MRQNEIQKDRHIHTIENKHKEKNTRRQTGRIIDTRQTEGEPQTKAWRQVGKNNSVLTSMNTVRGSLCRVPCRWGGRWW